MPNAERGRLLLILARGAIAETFGAPLPEMPQAPWLNEAGATFVTLTRYGRLRGCIGSLAACRPLADDVRANARAAAFRDPRFAPLTREEFAVSRVEVSLLSPQQAMSFSCEEDVLHQLRPGIDGLIFEAGHCRSTFLPQVWEQLPQPRAFLAQLKHKAGLAKDFWSPEVRLSRYTVDKWKEEST